MTDTPNRQGSGAMFVSYAQNFEDVLLWRALGHVGGGRYVDIGAQDPRIDSVSRAFHERDWHGVHVEPVRSFADALARERPGDTVIAAAVGTATGPVALHHIEGTGLSTVRDDIAVGHGRAGFSHETVVVPTVTLDAVLEGVPAGDIHWMKIDVEGAEADVLASWRDSNRRPWIVVVESTLPLSTETSQETWEPDLLARGYEFVLFDGLNRYYISRAHQELRPAFAAGANVFDDFALSGESSEPFSRLLRDDLATLRETLEVATTDRRRLEQKVAELRKELGRAVARRDAARHELASVYGSASWRVTAPLRRLRKASNEGRLRPRRVARAMVVRMARLLLRLPGMRQLARIGVSRFPRLFDRLKAMVTGRPATESIRARSVSAHLSHGSLSPKAARVLDELISAMGEGTK